MLIYYNDFIKIFIEKNKLFLFLNKKITFIKKNQNESRIFAKIYELNI
jgi:hypothetical protein